MSRQLRRKIWDSMLDADMHVRYWRYLAQRYRSHDKVAKIFLAITASSTVASWAIWTQYTSAWQILSGLSAVIAVALPIMKWSEEMQVTAVLYGEWNQLRTSYEQLWGKLDRTDQSEVERALEGLQNRETKLANWEITLPYDKKLLTNCQVEVNHSRGLS